MPFVPYNDHSDFTSIAAKAPNVEVFQAMITPIAIPLPFMSSILFKVSQLPNYFQWLANINPITWGAIGLRNILLKIPQQDNSKTKYTSWAITPPSFVSDFLKWIDSIFKTNLTSFAINNFLWIDIGILAITGAIFMYLCGNLFLKSLEG